ncbi:DUF2625 family protein [Campylobacter concisus]
MVEERLNKLKMGEILLRDESRAQSELLGLQVTTCSPIGALVYECSDIVRWLAAPTWLRM